MQKILLWGTGKIADEVLSKCLTLEKYDILGCIDNNCEKAGMEFHGFRVYEPNILNTIIPDKIVILTDAYEAICMQLQSQYPNFLNLVEDKYYFFRQSILQRYTGTDDQEIRGITEHIEKHGLQTFNYDFAENYNNIKVEPVYDWERQMFYVNHKDKKMYFSRKFDSIEKVAEYYRFLLMEQDIKSPHRYLTESFCVEIGDIVVDAGVAEGNFSLENIDKVKKLYLIETDVDWIDALKATFSDYMDKVTIIKAFVSDYDEGNIVSLDTLINEPVNFIKLDIEGNEWAALCGAKKLIAMSQKLKIAACVYHRDVDQILIETLMNQYGISHEISDGYMWFPWSTKLHRGLVRGTKK